MYKIYHSMQKAIKISEGKIYIPTENISRGIVEPSNPLLTRTIRHFTTAGENLVDEIQNFLTFRLQ